MPQFFSQYGMLIVLVIAMVGIMWFQSRNMKKRQTELRSFHDSLKPGVEVITIGGIIGKVVSVDADHEEIVLVIAMVGIMWFQSRNMKKRQTELRSFHDSLKPGVEVITIGGIIGKVVSVDADHEEIVLDSEGSLLRVSFRAVNRVYVRVDFNSYDKEDSAEGANNNADSAEDNESQESQESNESNEVQESSESNENKEN